MSSERGAAHSTAASLLSILDVLLAHMGWLSTTEVAARLGERLPGKAPSRDTTRRLLVELAAAEMVVEETNDEGSRWRLGPAVPRVAHGYQQWHARQAAQTRRELDEAYRPHALTWGRGGAQEWRAAGAGLSRDVSRILEALTLAGTSVTDRQLASWSDSQVAEALEWAHAARLERLGAATTHASPPAWLSLT